MDKSNLAQCNGEGSNKIDSHLDPVHELRGGLWNILQPTSLPLSPSFHLRQSLQSKHGDFQLLYSPLKEAPWICEDDVTNSEVIRKVQVASNVPYVNVWLSREKVLSRFICRILKEGENYGRNTALADFQVRIQYRKMKSDTLTSRRVVLLCRLVERLAKFQKVSSVHVKTEESIPGNRLQVTVCRGEEESTRVSARINIGPVKVHDGPERTEASVISQLEESQIRMGLNRKEARRLAEAELLYALLRTKSTSTVNIYLQKMQGDGEDSPAAVILYNRSRVESILCRLEKCKVKGAPDWSLLSEDDWKLFWHCIAPLPSLLKESLLSARTTRASQNVIEEMNTQQSFHSLAEFLFRIAKFWSRYYSRARVLVRANPGLMNARVELVKAFRHVFDTCLSLLGIEPLHQM